MRAHVVCTATARRRGRLGLYGDVRARGRRAGRRAVEIDGLSRSPGVLAAIMEAAVGAGLPRIRGLDGVAEPVVAAFSSRIEYALAEHVDAKTGLSRKSLHVGEPR